MVAIPNKQPTFTNIKKVQIAICFNPRFEFPIGKCDGVHVRFPKSAYVSGLTQHRALKRVSGGSLWTLCAHNGVMPLKPPHAPA